MSSNGWNTIKDVMNDLAKVTGKRVKGFDKKFLVAGQQPPPVELIDEDEDDIREMYGEFVSRDSIKASPDLAGITQMLRMVNDHYDDPTYDDHENIKELENDVKTVITISKLNSTNPSGTSKLRLNSPEPRSSANKLNRNSVIPTSKVNLKNADSGSKLNPKSAVTGSKLESISVVTQNHQNPDITTPVRKTNVNSVEKTNILNSSSANTTSKLDNRTVSTSNINAKSVSPVKKINSNIAVPTRNLYPNHENNLNANSLVSTSKLNPNVPEFVPRTVSNSDMKRKSTSEEIEESNNSKDAHMKISASKESCVTSLEIKENCGCNHNIINNETIETDNNSHSVTNNNEIDINKKIDISNLHIENIKDIKQKLKLKIINASKANCHKKKGERNVAIAVLLKINAANIEKPLKLMTPEYFKTVPEKTECFKSYCDYVNAEVNHGACAVQNGESNEKNYINNVPMKLEDKTLEKGDNALLIEQDRICIQIPDSHINTASLQKQNVWENQTTEPIVKDAPSCRLQKENFDEGENETPESIAEETQSEALMSKEIKESVKKVNNWLNPTEKKKHKAPAVYLGPVTFRKKGSASLSPSVEVSENSASTITSDSFVPSSYADELTKSFMERSKAKEIETEDIWTRLERKLKEKDKAIKK